MKDFSLSDFCSVFKLPVNQTYSALKLLQQAGYIELTDEMNHASRVMFLVTKEELYEQPIEHDPKLDEILQLLLRSYTGLFAEYASIDEEMMARRLDLSRDDLYHKLAYLAKLRIIGYVPGKKSPYVIYTQRRVADGQVKIGRDIYEKRLERFQERIDRVIAYVENDDHCRSRMLLQYFGEDSSDNCGTCDYCLSKNESGLTNFKFSSIKKCVVEALKDSRMDVKSLVRNMSYPENQSVATIRRMQDDDEIMMDDDGFLVLKSCQ